MKFNPSNGNNNRAVFELIAGLVVGVGLCVLGLVFLPGAWKIIPAVFLALILLAPLGGDL